MLLETNLRILIFRQYCLRYGLPGQTGEGLDPFEPRQRQTSERYLELAEANDLRITRRRRRPTSTPDFLGGIPPVHPEAWRCPAAYPFDKKGARDWQYEMGLMGLDHVGLPRNTATFSMVGSVLRSGDFTPLGTTPEHPEELIPRYPRGGSPPRQHRLSPRFRATLCSLGRTSGPPPILLRRSRPARQRDPQDLPPNALSINQKICRVGLTNRLPAP